MISNVLGVRQTRPRLLCAGRHRALAPLRSIDQRGPVSGSLRGTDRSTSRSPRGNDLDPRVSYAPEQLVSSWLVWLAAVAAAQRNCLAMDVKRKLILKLGSDRTARC